MHCPGVLAVLPLFLVTGGSAAIAQVGSFDIGWGLGFADASFEGFEGGPDIQFGYEWKELETWHIGAQLQVIRGWTTEEDLTGGTEMLFDSAATYLTFRPKKRWMGWIQLKAGVAYADYRNSVMEGSGLGLATGIGVVVGSGMVRVHLIDYVRYEIDGHGFNVYSLNFSLMFGE